MFVVQGMIRTVIGQVQLLVTKKFKQFKGLIDLSEVCWINGNVLGIVKQIFAIVFLDYGSVIVVCVS